MRLRVSRSEDGHLIFLQHNGGTSGYSPEEARLLFNALYKVLHRGEATWATEEQIQHEAEYIRLRIAEDERNRGSHSGFRISRAPRAKLEDI